MKRADITHALSVHTPAKITLPWPSGIEPPDNPNVEWIYTDETDESSQVRTRRNAGGQDH